MNDSIVRLVHASGAAIGQMARPDIVNVIERIAGRMIEAVRAGNKILMFGNGGSAADAQHFAAELVCRFEKNRAAIPAMALTTNTSSITAIGNDFSFEDLFSRQVAAFARPGDVVLGISTSGNSPNILKSLDQARAMKAFTVAFTGISGGKLRDRADLCLCAPASVTARVQECHILAIHIISGLVEDAVCGDKP